MEALPIRINSKVTFSSGGLIICSCCSWCGSCSWCDSLEVCCMNSRHLYSCIEFILNNMMSRPNFALEGIRPQFCWAFQSKMSHWCMWRSHLETPRLSLDRDSLACREVSYEIFLGLLENAASSVTPRRIILHANMQQEANEKTTMKNFYYVSFACA